MTKRFWIPTAILSITLALICQWWASQDTPTNFEQLSEQKQPKTNKLTFPSKKNIATQENYVAVTPESSQQPMKPTIVTALPSETNTLTQSNTNPIKPQIINLQKMSSSQLWRYWQDLVMNTDLQQIPIVNALLAEHLRKQANPDIYAEISQTLAHPEVASQTKALLIDLLTEIATPESLKQLLQLSTLGSENPLYIQVLDAIARVGENRWDGRFHEELSPLLEAAWSDPNEFDEAFLSASGKAIADIGASSGVNLLLQTLINIADKSKADEHNQARGESAFYSIPQVRNPLAVSTLGNSLTNEPIGSPAFEASGDALSQMGTTESTKTVGDWAHAASANGTPNFRKWAENINGNGTKNVLIAGLGKPFKSPEMQTAYTEVTSSVASSTDAAVTGALVAP